MQRDEVSTEDQKPMVRRKWGISRWERKLCHQMQGRSVLHAWVKPKQRGGEHGWASPHEGLKRYLLRNVIEMRKHSSSDEPGMGKGLNFKLYFVLLCQGPWRISAPFPLSSRGGIQSHLALAIIPNYLHPTLNFRLGTKKETVDTKVGGRVGLSV